MNQLEQLTHTVIASNSLLLQSLRNHMDVLNAEIAGANFCLVYISVGKAEEGQKDKSVAQITTTRSYTSRGHSCGFLSVYFSR